MKTLSSLIVLFSCSLFVFSQSGRVKPTETPAPAAPTRGRGVYNPTQTNTEVIKPVLKPTPPPAGLSKPKPQEEDEGDGEVIRVDASLVPIPVSVTDSQGRAITNLTLKDFELEIDAQPAEISDVSRSQLPVRLALLFDNSSSVVQAREFEKNAAIRFFKQVIRPEKDQAALYSISTVSRLEQPLTSNVAQLIQSIQYFPPPVGATALLDGIIKAADYLKAAEGRRVIVIVSDGEDTYSELETTLEKTVQAVLKANCQIYVVKTTDFENFKKTGFRGGNANIRALTAERRMQELATQTGGAVYSPVDETELVAAFTRISAELSEQYILNYYPNEDAFNAQFRTISLRVKNRKDLTVRTRKGYYVSRR
jgi:Ca-activated chloride channel family protein